jgi:PhnB protein
MSSQPHYIRDGFSTVRPYLFGRLDLADFVRQVFGAQELARRKYGEKAFHIESKIGDSVVVLEVREPPYPTATTASVYLYVDDVDAAYKRAIEAGATSVSEPKDQPYQERNAGVRDSFGNIWYIATYMGPGTKQFR